MTDSLLDTKPATLEAAGPDGPQDNASQGARPGNGSAATPPDGLPEKFWDAETGELRTDSLVKSYLSLEQKLGAAGGLGVPDDPGGYDIKSDDALFESDPEVNAKLHAAGFSQEQAQTVYELAAEYLSPLVNDVAAEFHAQTQIDRLAEKFGGEDKWRETAAQLKQWGRAHFPDEIFQALSSTHEGVLTMHKMMNTGEPGLIEGAGAGGEGLSEESLKQMMQDPRYWRDHEPGFVQKVQDGFKRLFPD